MCSIEVDGGKIVSEVQGVDMTWAIKSSQVKDQASALEIAYISMVLETQA